MSDLLDQIATLRSVIRGKNRQIRDLKSGALYVSLQKATAQQRKTYEARIERLEKALVRERKERAKEAKGWYETTEALLKERDRAIACAVGGATKDATKQLKKELSHSQKRARDQEARALRAERRLQERDTTIVDLKNELALRLQKIEKLEAFVAKLQAQLNKDFENSSLPSSAQGPKRKPIPNTREPTQRRPGAQRGHPHHPRKRPDPDQVVWLTEPSRFTQDPDLYPTDHIVTKTEISVELTVCSTEYRARLYRKRSTGARTHTPFPHRLKDDVSYDASVKALAFLLTQGCETSLAKATTFLKEISHGALQLSCGMVWNLSREFCQKSEPERRAALKKLLCGPYLGADFTCARVGAKDAQVLILANQEACAMVAKKHKGHQGVKGSPLEAYVGRIIHDHDSTFYSYGASHQECMQHNIRYLVGSIQTEPHLSWNVKMLALIREMLHWRNSLDLSDLAPPDKLSHQVASFRKRFDQILELARQEYDHNPPTKYNREGFNLAKRLGAYKESELAFLEHLEVPADNSRCERLARVFKRKQHQAITFRSLEGLSLATGALSTLENIRNEGGDLFCRTQEIFSR